MTLWEISVVTITAAFPSAGSVMALITVATAQTKETAVSVMCFFFFFSNLVHFKTFHNAKMTTFIHAFHAVLSLS